MSTVLITGCSTGFGRETAAYFLEQGWNVVATMRNPSASTLPASDGLRVLPLDVTNAESIAAAVAEAGAIDVLVNNAGIGWLNAVEGTSMETVRRIFETNTFSTVAMMQAVLPGMRDRRAGVIVNVSSSTTIKPLPLLSIYRASKAAVNALTESAALELAEFGIRARVVVPGAAPRDQLRQHRAGADRGERRLPRRLRQLCSTNDGCDAAACRKRRGDDGAGRRRGGFPRSDRPRLPDDPAGRCRRDRLVQRPLNDWFGRHACARIPYSQR